MTGFIFHFFLLSNPYLYCSSGLVRTHRIKITSIIASRFLPSFSASDEMIFVSFLETCTLYGYFMTPCYQVDVILSTFFHPSFDYHSTSHNSPRHHLYMKNFFPKHSPEKLCVNICSVIQTSYVFALQLMNSKFL